MFRFFLHRNINKDYIKSKVRKLLSKFEMFSKEEEEQLSCHPADLKAMQSLIRMRENADANDAAFVGGFVSSTGKMFMVNNLHADVYQVELVRQKLLTMEQDVKKSNNSLN